jgi:hydrogenase maturation protein HypF
MERRSIAIHGMVQGVGFRPFVHGLASRLGLGGSVRNDAGSVVVEVEGEIQNLEQFLRALETSSPTLARIDRINWHAEKPRGQRGFKIEPSSAGGSQEISICPDIATCVDCLKELFDRQNRRYRYPFTNCVNCGPRLTIIQGAPYDRQRTTMAGFAMCPACRREYEDPLDRRFHAQPIACADCGPRLMLLDAEGERMDCDHPLGLAADALRGGKIVAIKGLGGFHLACNASDDSAGAELRRRKHRDEKPFAVMVRDLEAASALCEISQVEAQILQSQARPVVILRRRADCGLPDDIAPGNPDLGVMLPYTPLHHLLLEDLGDMTLVMTSGNRSDEPIAYEDDDAASRLAGIADLFLTHNRPIHVRCDDSVVKVIGESQSPIRRSRGYAPGSLRLPIGCAEPMLAVGGQLKATFALGRGDQAIVSHHLGDLDHLEAFRAFERDIALYQRSFSIEPGIIVHDLHPDYASTRYALRRCDEQQLRRVAVQHHHAHMASCMAEHGLNEPVIGVCFDGTGFGTDGNIWGGEFLVGDYREFRRAAHLRYVGMPGGDAVVKSPWRMAVAHLADADWTDETPLFQRIPQAALRTTRAILQKRFNSPLTSSVGRLFDAVAALAGVRDSVSFEGQAAIELEFLAATSTDDGNYPFEIDASTEILVDTRPLIRAIASDVRKGCEPRTIARRFHSTLAKIVEEVCLRIRAGTGVDAVVLSGGVFMNSLLAKECQKMLCKANFRVYRHERIPANDGGLSFGQLAIAAKRS